MFSNQISACEYVSILVSIILGLGITQILAGFSDLLYPGKGTKLYWPHTVWVLFTLFLHVQDWFITYQLKDKSAWTLPELLFILLYPVTLFVAVKMLLPAKENNKGINMKEYYNSHYPIVFFVVCIAALFSLLFNVFLLQKPWSQQLLLLAFSSILIYTAVRKIQTELLHKAIAVLIGVTSILSIILEKSVWVIK